MIFFLHYYQFNYNFGKLEVHDGLDFYTDVFRIDTLTHLCPPLRSTFAVREIASLGIVGETQVPPSEMIVLSEHYRL